MAKAKRANHRSGDNVVVDGTGGAVDNGVRGEDGAVLSGYRIAAMNGQPPNGQLPNGHAPNGPGANRPGQNAPGQNAQSQKAPSQNAKGQNAKGQNGQGQTGPSGPVQNGADGREVAVAPRRDARAAGFGTPVRVDQIAVAAMALSEDLLAATKGLPESIASRQFRRDLDEAADTFRTVANELETTAGNLVRLAATEGQTCGVTWGICADHGLTLMNVGEEVVTCHVLGCHREQEAVVERCAQPVAYRVVDVAGPALLTCAGHAIACRVHLDGAVITLASDSLELL